MSYRVLQQYKAGGKITDWLVSVFTFLNNKVTAGSKLAGSRHCPPLACLFIICE